MHKFQHILYGNFPEYWLTVKGDHLLNRSALHSGQCRINTLQALKKLQPSTLNNVEPPERTMFWNNTLRRSKSDFCMEYTRTSWRPSYSSPMRSGRNKTSGALNRAGPIYRWRDNNTFQLQISGSTQIKHLLNYTNHNCL